MTSRDLQETSTESVKTNKKNNLKGGNPNDDTNQGRALIEQAFSSKQMADFIEIIKKGSKVQNEIAQFIENYNKLSN